jgi:serine/threonine protein kinase
MPDETRPEFDPEATEPAFDPIFDPELTIEQEDLTEQLRTEADSLDATRPATIASPIALDETLPDETILQTELNEIATLFEAAGIPLAETHVEESLKLPSTTGGTTSATRSTVASVVVRSREVTYGHTDHHNAEYEIAEMLGEGGMGSVYRARQNSIDRSVALKMIKSGSVSSSNNDKFLTEAVITGDLEHPNIVPIYDLGSNASGDLFYAMKEVRGAPWRKTIDTASEEDNLEVLHKVADAIAFSHSRGVLHRDLKPDNVMIGEFGEVLVMDWGLALPVGHFEKEGLALSLGPCGTPAYMAPEMARQNGKVTTASDVYLLGAQLFRLATGKAPHTAKSARECLRAAARNEILEVERDDELVAIARKAMSTRPEHRHATAQEFQAALGEYRSHKESRAMTERAIEKLSNARNEMVAGPGDYRPFERALVSFEEAISLWEGNEEARNQLREAQLSYAQSAFAREDFDLASQQLDETAAEHAELLAEIHSAKEEYDSRLARLQNAKRIATGLAASIFLVVSVASFLLYRSWRSEQQAHSIAQEQFHQAHEAIDRLSGISEDLQYFPRLQTVRTNLLKMVADYYELHTEAEHGGSLDRELAQSLLKLGEVHALLQDHEKAIKTFGKASSVAGQADETRSDAEYQRVILDAALKIAASELARGNIDEAEAARKSGWEQVKILEPLAKESDLFEARAAVQSQTGRILERRGEFLLAAGAQRQAAQFFKASGTETAQENAAMSLILAGQACDQAGQPKEAIRVFEEAIAIWEELQGHSPDIPDYLEGLATANISLANVQRDVGQNSEETYRDAARAFDALIQARPEIPRYRFNRATALVNLAWLLNQSAPGIDGQSEEAQQLAVEATNEFIRLAGGYPEGAEYADGEAASRSVLGEILRDRRELGLAEDMFVRAADHYATRIYDLGDGSPPQYRDLLAVNVSHSAQITAIIGSSEGAEVEDATEKLNSAVRQWKEAFEQIRPLVPASHEGSEVPQYYDDAAWILSHLADGLWRLGRKDEARKYAQLAVGMRLCVGVTSPQHSDNAAWLLVHSLVPDIHNAEEAVEWARHATDAAPSNPDYQNTLAAAYLEAGDVKKAEAALSLAEKNRKAPSPADQFVRSMIERKKGNTEKADEILAVAIKLADETAPGNPKLLRLRIEAKVASQSPAE